MQQQTYSDLPEGAQVVSAPQSAQYSDLPQGAQIVHDPQDPGAFKRFAARTLGIPEDVFEHPNKWLNPFSKEFNSPEHKAEQQQMVPNDGSDPNRPLNWPGVQTFQDIKSGNYAGAAGDLLNTAAQFGPLVHAGMKASAPVELPNIYEGPVPEDIPAGKPQNPSTVAHVAKKVAPLLAREVTGKIPLLDRLGSTRVPTISEYLEAFRSRPTPAAAQPTIGNVSNAEIRGPYQPYEGDLTVQPEIQPKQPAQRNAPIRGESQTIQTFSGSTPEEIAANAERIAANRAARQQLAPAAAGQTPIPQEAAPILAQESASGTLNRLPSESPLTGEQALKQILTGQDNANLMRIAKSRGINVTKEAQLKPGIADRLLVNKIVDDFGPEELDEIGAKYLESSRFKHNFGDVGPEAWKAMSLQTYFPDVKLPAAVIKRVNAAIASAAPQPAAPSLPPQAMAQAAAAGAEIPQELAPQVPANGNHMVDLLQKSIEMQRLLNASGIKIGPNGEIIRTKK